MHDYRIGGIVVFFDERDLLITHNTRQRDPTVGPHAAHLPDRWHQTVGTQLPGRRCAAPLGHLGDCSLSAAACVVAVSTVASAASSGTSPPAAARRRARQRGTDRCGPPDERELEDAQRCERVDEAARAERGDGRRRRAVRRRRRVRRERADDRGEQRRQTRRVVPDGDLREQLVAAPKKQPPPSPRNIAKKRSPGGRSNGEFQGGEERESLPWGERGQPPHAAALLVAVAGTTRESHAQESAPSWQESAHILLACLSTPARRLCRTVAMCSASVARDRAQEEAPHSCAASKPRQGAACRRRRRPRCLQPRPPPAPAAAAA